MYYITTPIYYVNDEPHLGHAYTTLLADTLARYARLQGETVFFLTGVDEHGQKVENAVRRRAASDRQAYVDEMAARFRAAWARLDVAYDDFIRTSEPRHKRVVQHVLQKLWDEGQIYRGEYEGWYCVPDERFWTEKDLLGGNCPDCGRTVERLVEANYFFRMGQYQDWLVETIQSNPDFIRPAYRRAEVLGFLRQPLGDLCISRPVQRLSWGIPLPFDPAYVTYVWFDALLNYVTAAGYLEDEARFARQWPQALHLIGKDILITHSVYWPTMLHAAGLPLPKAIFAHGWWVIEGAKMGKSLGNAVRPLDLAEIYGADAFRYFLLREMTPGQDADFSAERAAGRYTVDLANNLGNLLQRVTTLITRACGGRVPGPGAGWGAEEDALRAQVEALPARVFERTEKLEVSAALEAVMDLLTAVNGYLERAAPWKLAKDPQSAGRVGTVLYCAAESLRAAAALLTPALPHTAPEALVRLGYAQEITRASLAWGGLRPGSPVTVGEPLFPRVEI